MFYVLMILWVFMVFWVIDLNWIFNLFFLYYIVVRYGYLTGTENNNYWNLKVNLDVKIFLSIKYGILVMENDY